jgi:hypothetical protein
MRNERFEVSKEEQKKIMRKEIEHQLKEGLEGDTIK